MMTPNFSWLKWFFLAFGAFTLGVVACWVWVILQLIPG